MWEMVQAIPAPALMDAGAQESLRFGTVALGPGLAHRSFRSIEMALSRDYCVTKRYALGFGWGSDRFCNKRLIVGIVGLRP